MEERTIQRIEAGQQVSEETLRKVARALGMTEGCLSSARYVPTAEEIAAEVEKVQRDRLVVNACAVEDVKDCQKLFESHCCLPDQSRVAPDALAKVAEFTDMWADWSMVYGEISFGERLEAAQSVLKAIREIEILGYRVFYSVYRSDDGFDVAVITWAPTSSLDLRQLVVPRRVREQMAAFDV